MNETESAAAKREKRNQFFWNVREQLGSVDAMRAYDAYVKEWKQRLRQLNAIATGSMAPSGAWHKDYK